MRSSLCSLLRLAALAVVASEWSVCDGPDPKIYGQGKPMEGSGFKVTGEVQDPSVKGEFGGTGTRSVEYRVTLDAATGQTAIGFMFVASEGSLACKSEGCKALFDPCDVEKLFGAVVGPRVVESKDDTTPKVLDQEVVWMLPQIFCNPPGCDVLARTGDYELKVYVIEASDSWYHSSITSTVTRDRVTFSTGGTVTKDSVQDDHDHDHGRDGGGGGHGGGHGDHKKSDGAAASTTFAAGTLLAGLLVAILA